MHPYFLGWGVVLTVKHPVRQVLVLLLEEAAVGTGELLNILAERTFPEVTQRFRMAPT